MNKDPRYSYQRRPYGSRQPGLKNPSRPWNKTANNNLEFMPEMYRDDLITNKFKPIGSNYYAKNTPFGQVMYEKNSGEIYKRIK
jgi:hypothetical protein